MAYEKKTEPLTRFEAFMFGFTLLLFMLILQILPWSNSALICDDESLTLSVSSEDDVYTLHNCIKDNRTLYLFASTCLLLGYPIILLHIYYTRRVCETVYSCFNSNLFQTLYYSSWLIISAIYCIILPALLILIAYYDWEFTSDHQYLGYAVQFQFLCFFDLVADCVWLPMGITASLPWILILTVILGYNKSVYYNVPFETTLLIVSQNLGCGGDVARVSTKYIILFICFTMAIIPLVGSFVDVFDFDKKGFFSYHGKSQYVGLIIFISEIVYVILNITIAINFNKVKNILNNTVKPIALSKRENESFDDSKQDVSNTGGVSSAGSAGDNSKTINLDSATRPAPAQQLSAPVEPVEPVVPEIDFDDAEAQDDGGL